MMPEIYQSSAPALIILPGEGRKWDVIAWEFRAVLTFNLASAGARAGKALRARFDHKTHGRKILIATDWQ